MARNQTSAVGALNLLRLAGLDEHFSVIWGMPARDATAEGACGDAVFQAGGQWDTFQPPACGADLKPADVLRCIAQDPTAWFPQLGSCQSDEELRHLQQLRPQEIALIDDERANFFSNTRSGAAVYRYCKVMNYDEDYRDCGFLNQMGGIGAHSDRDYHKILAFIQAPWEFPYNKARPQTILPGMEGKLAAEKTPEKVCAEMRHKVPTMRRERASTEEEPSKAPRRRPCHAGAPPAG